MAYFVILSKVSSKWEQFEADWKGANKTFKRNVRVHGVVARSGIWGVGDPPMGDATWSFAGDGRGTTAIEYGLIAALIAMAIVAAVGIFGTDLIGLFASVANSM